MSTQIFEQSEKIVRALQNYSGQFFPILGHALGQNDIYVLDFSEYNLELAKLDISNAELFTKYVFDKIRENSCKVGIGKYNEDRVIYRYSSLFANAGEPRSLHLGIDIFAESNTPIVAPLTGSLHSFQDNTARGDYGPTIIVDHDFEGVKFHTLYGHLSRESISSLQIGQKFNAGEKLGEVGNQTVNGGWPPHVHFEIITDMLGKFGDFYGVAPVSEGKYYMALCPDPNLILQIPGL